MVGRVFRRGDTWTYVFDIGTVNNKRKQKSKGGFRDSKVAAKAMRKAIDEFESNGKVFEAKKMALREYLDYWMENYVKTNLKFTTYNNYTKDLKNHILPELGDYDINKLSGSRLQKFFTDKHKVGYKPNTIRGFYGVLSGALKYAVKWKFLRASPMTEVVMPSRDETVREVKVLTIDDINKILDRFDETSNFYIPIVIALNTGLRAAEVCGITWDNINFENNTLHVNKILQIKEGTWIFTTPKTKGSTRNMVMTGSLREALITWKRKQDGNRQLYAEYYKDSKNVCTKEDGTYITTDSLKYASRVINKSLGIKYHFHMLRHTHATMLLEQGIHPKIVQERLGHRKITTTLDTYSHVSMNLQMQAVGKFDEYLSGKIGSKRLVSGV